jgi:Tol biopolymer transport system component
MVENDTNGVEDVFVRDRLTDTTKRVSVTATGEQADGLSGGASISSDGYVVAFASNAANLVPPDQNQYTDVFVRDLRTGVTTLADVSPTGEQANAYAARALVSPDGRHVVFDSEATNLFSGDSRFGGDVFIRNLR